MRAPHKGGASGTARPRQLGWKASIVSRSVTHCPAGEAPALPRCRDRDDQKFLELAARAQADVLVSKDKALLKLRGRTRLPFRILTPAAACALLVPGSAMDAAVQSSA